MYLPGEQRADLVQPGAERAAVFGGQVPGLPLPEQAELPVVQGEGAEPAQGGRPVGQVEVGQQRAYRGEAAGEHLAQQVLLAGDVPVEGGRADADRLGQVAHGELAVAAAVEQVGGGGEDQVPAVAGPGAARRGGVRGHGWS